MIGDVTYADRTATFTSSSPLANLVTYTATLTTDIMDTSGKPLPGAYSWSFTTVSLGQTPAPEFMPPAGTYDSPQTVALSCADASAAIYYTINGDMPDSLTGTQYTTTPITVDQSITIRAIAVKEGYDDSEIAEGAYLIKAPKPSFTPEAGEHNHDIDVTLSVTGGAAIYYTTGTGDPDTLYNSGDIIEVHGDGESTTIRAWAVKDGLENSDILEGTFTVNYDGIAAPTFTPGEGTYGTAQTVTLETTAVGATIRYTCDGSDPKDAENVNAHNVASGTDIEIAENTTLNAYAFLAGMKDSSTTTGEYYIHVAAPEASEAEGTHDHNLAVQLTAATGATIYYTLGSGDPDTPYDDASPIKIEGDNATATIRAKAVKAGMTDSGVVSFSYEVQWGTAETPVFDPASASFTTPQNVTITSTTGSTIRYTTNNDDPTTATCPSTTCFEAASPAEVALTDTTTLRAFAYKDQLLDSEQAQKTYILVPTLVSVTPAEGVGTGTVGVTIVGTNFQAGADVRLKKSAASDIVATNIVVTSATEITADLDITGAACGRWDLAVTNTDTGSATLAEGFRVFNNNADLSDLVVSKGTLTPTFDSGTVLYYIRVTDGSTSMTVTPTLSDTNATVTVNGETAASDAATSVSLTGGNTRIAVTVTAEDGVTQKTYVVSVMTCPRFAYVTNMDDNTVSMYTVNATTGQLRHNGYVDTGALPISVTVDPAGRFVYVPNNAGNSVSVYTINQSTGKLVAGTAVSVGTCPAMVAINPTGEFAYIENAGSNNVSIYSIDQATGALSGGTTISAGSGPNAIAIDPSGKFVYVPNINGNNVSVYTVTEGTGALTGPTNVTVGSNPNSVAIDPVGRFAYIVNGSDKTIAVYTIDQSTGLLALKSSASTGSSSAPGGIAFDPAGRFLYVIDFNGSTVIPFTINQSDGALSIGTPVSVTTPSGIAIDPSGTYLSVSNGNSNTITVYTIDQDTGALTAASIVSGRSRPISIAYTSKTSALTYVPKYAYAANQNSGSVSCYTIGSGGALTWIDDASTGASSRSPYSVAVDPTGSYVYAPNLNNNDVAVFTIGSGGYLTAGTAASVSPSTVPMSVAVDPSGRFVYTADEMNSGNNVSVFAIGSGGALTAKTFAAAGSYPMSVAVDPSGRYAYVVNQGGKSISAFSINKSTGLLSAVGTTTSVGTNPRCIAVEASGRYAYVADQNTSTTITTNLYVYSISQTAGTLTQVGSAVAVGIQPYNVTVDPWGRYVYVVNTYSSPASISVLKIDQSTGTVATVETKTGSSLNYPTAAAVDPSGSYLYVTNCGTTGPVTLFTIDQDTGALTEGSTATSQRFPYGIATTGVIQ